VAAEVNFGWMPFWMRQMDLEWEKGRNWDDVCKQRPSEYVGRNAFTTVLDDSFGFETLDEHLSSAIMYSTDYPHAAGLWPNTATVVPKLMGHLDPAWKTRVLAGNAVRVFNL
jgi:predicted TIM-barrel fold metal-dependent hydrolase